MPYPADPVVAPRRRRRWPLFLPFALIVLLAIAWTGFWFYAASRAEVELAAWRQREQQAGRMLECATQSIGGYPFRLEVRCAGAAVELKGTPTLQIKLPSVLAAVQVYDPTLVISEFTAPVEISEPGQPPLAIADWRLGQASVRGLPSSIERTSVVLDTPSLRMPGVAGADPVFKAQRLELHGRQAAGSTPDNPVIETVVHLNSAVADRLHPVAAKPINADIAASLRGLDDISPKRWPVRFREWQARDGQLEILKARLVQEDVIAVGAGTLRLTPRGGLDGNLQVTVVGIEKLLKTFDIERFMSEGQVGATLSALDRLIPGLGGIARQSAAPGLVAALGQRTELEGKPAVAFPVRFADGAVFLGPFQVGVIPPLF
jgi:hypothetical protein